MQDWVIIYTFKYSFLNFIFLEIQYWTIIYTIKYRF